MKLIEKIEIQYFRSIFKETINDISDLNIFTGKNDVGKSNVLKALNLFFNNETDIGSQVNFIDDFNLIRRAEVKQDSIKGKQFIQIKITFLRGNRSPGTLPEKFTVTKKWLRNDVNPIVSDDIKSRREREGLLYNDRCKSSLTAYLNSLKYIYIPAIKDSETFKYILTELRDSLYNEKLASNTVLNTSLASLADSASNSSIELNEEFKQETGIDSSLTTPKTISQMFTTLEVDTISGDFSIGLNKRGDGIRVRYIPSIMHYISKNSKKFYIWGFEEPENSLEYNYTISMADSFVIKYCKESMIFITSHSPAFITIEKSNTSIFRCFKKANRTEILPINKANKEPDISEELGYIKLQKELHGKYIELKKNTQLLKENSNRLEESLRTLQKPVVITEGKTDVLILTTAWEKLNNEIECPFLIKSCNILDENSEGSAAGCKMLANYLCSIPHDSIHLAIGVFDKDEEGINSYALSANYKEHDSHSFKYCKNKKGFSFLLPVPPGKEAFAESKNLCIEYYFELSDLERKINGLGLLLKPRSIEEKCNGQIISRRPATEMHLKDIDKSTKTYFAETIVPTLPKESFVHFKLIFDLIEQIISEFSTDHN
ncbi:MAG: hypothetical protein BGN88_01340 [Clostridiales bacterium 43-6]|nr:MAG: hypothetical protein BGN88_01340 [Clostridiales bacterium 43-6]